MLELYVEENLVSIPSGGEDAQSALMAWLRTRPLEEVARMCDQHIETSAGKRLVVDFSYSLGVSECAEAEQATQS